MKWREISWKKTCRTRSSRALLLAAFSAISISVVAASEPKRDINSDPEKLVLKNLDIATLVTRLGDDSFAVRVASMTELWSRGTKILPELRRVAESNNDPEISSRIEELVLYVSAGVLPNSSDEVKRLVLDFSQGGIDAKLTILRKLMEIGQWQQVLYLAKFEKNPEYRKKMSSQVRVAASGSAKRAIAEGKMDLAREILELVGDDEQNTLLRAWFFVWNGELKEQLKKAEGMEAKKAAVWRMSLHRANGDYSKAIIEAEKAGLDELAAGMKVLTGESLPWIEKVGERYHEQREGQLALSIARDLQKANLLGKHKQANALVRELTQIGDDEGDVRLAAMGLAANGYAKEAVALMVTEGVEDVFAYYNNVQKPEKCLKLLGISEGAKPPYKKWVEDTTKGAIDDDELSDKILLLAGFLDGHGETEHAIEVMRPLMQELAKDGDEKWLKMLGRLSDYGLRNIALTLVEERAGEEGVADAAITNIFDSSNYVRTVWELLKKRHPEKVDQALYEISILTGLVPDVKNETDKLHQALVEEVILPDFQDEGVKKQRLEALYGFAFRRDNIMEASRLADLLSKDQESWVNAKNFLDASLHRWRKVETVYAKIAEEKPGDYLNLTNWYVSLRKLGRDEAAQKVYKRAFLLTMGDAESLRKMGSILFSAGFSQEAAEVWERALVMSAAGSRSYSAAVNVLTFYKDFLYNSKQWGKAAALNEVRLFDLMNGFSGSSLGRLLRARFNADFSQGMYMLGNGQRDLAIKKLDSCRKLVPGDGSLADHFFPALRNKGLDEYYDRWFEETYQTIAGACEFYPRSHNAHNTAAWLASRAVRRLDDAHRHAELATTLLPQQGAYIDTMAEVWFARGNRAKAVEWSEKAVASTIGNAQGHPKGGDGALADFAALNKQLERFKTEALPE